MAVSVKVDLLTGDLILAANDAVAITHDLQTGRLVLITPTAGATTTDQPLRIERMMRGFGI